jgi:hypothetical protein
MKTILLFFGSLLSLSSFSQTYYLEDFDGIPGPTAGGAGTYTFAPGFFLRNVDNRTPAATVSYVNEAWERREDFGSNVVDSVAFSNSYYSPIGGADDFMWTPAQTILPNTTLFWNAKAYDPAYPDGYEVRIMTGTPPTGGTGVIGNQVTNSTVVFSIVSESSSWVNHSVPMSAYAGQSVYIGFRNNSNDKFILVIDDIELRVVNNYDLAVTSSTENPYTVAPANQLTTTENLKLEATITNSGILASTNVALGCNIILDGVVQTTVTSSSIPSLAAGASSTMTVNYIPTTEGNYTFKFFPIATETDMATANDTLLSSIPILVTDVEMARDNGVVVGQLGIGAGTTGYLGQVFNIETTTSVESVKVYFTRGYTGKRLATVLYNTSGGVPTTFLATTDTLLYIDDSARTYTLPIYGGPLTLAPGKYGFMQVEFDSTLAVGQTSAVFKNNTVFVQWAANGPNFTPIENFGTSFTKSFMIRPQFNICFGEIGGVLASSVNSTCELANGEASLTLDPGYTVEWEDLSTDPNITGLAAGYHTYTISNDDCSFVDSVEITTTENPDITSLSITNPFCNTSDGQIEIVVQNGQAPYTIEWNGIEGSTIFIGPAGAYTATVTDAGGCITGISAVLFAPDAITATSASVESSCSNCPDGEASVSPSGGTPPYSYLWSNGEMTDTISDELPGIYNVTITDVNGCELIESVTIPFSTAGIEDLAQFGLSVYPNPMTDFIKIESKKYVVESVKLIDNSGRVVLEKTINSKFGTIETSQLAKGGYQVILKTKTQTFTFQVVK